MVPATPSYVWKSAENLCLLRLTSWQTEQFALLLDGQARMLRVDP